MKVVFNSSNRAKIHQYQIQIHEIQIKMNISLAAVFLALLYATVSKIIKKKLKENIKKKYINLLY